MPRKKLAAASALLQSVRHSTLTDAETAELAARGARTYALEQLHNAVEAFDYAAREVRGHLQRYEEVLGTDARADEHRADQVNWALHCAQNVPGSNLRMDLLAKAECRLRIAALQQQSAARGKEEV